MSDGDKGLLNTDVDNKDAKPADGAPPADDKKPDDVKPPVDEKSGDKKDGDDKSSGDSSKDAKPDPAKAKPVEAKDIEITLPEGFNADTELLNEFKPLAKEVGLDSAKAQKVVELYAKGVAKAQEKMQQENRESFAQLRESWVSEAKADKELGGEKFTENLTVAKRAVKMFGTEKLVSMMDQLGVSDHPEFVRLMYRIGKSIKEDSVVVPSGTGATDRNAEEPNYSKMYPNSNMK